jgi:post-segregation antitoxin (ccd killing protein)
MSKFETAEQLKAKAMDEKVQKARKASLNLSKVLESKIQIENQKEKKHNENLEKSEFANQKITELKE